MTYPVLDDLKSYLDIDSVTDDVILQTFLDNAIQYVETYTSRTFVRPALSETRTVVIDPNIITSPWSGYLILNLEGEDIESVVTITNTALDPITDFNLWPKNRPPHFGLEMITFSEWTTGSTVDIDAFWAYSENCPDDVSQAIIRLASHFYRQKDTQMSTDVDSVVVSPSGVMIKASAMPRDVSMMLTRYMRQM